MNRILVACLVLLCASPVTVPAQHSEKLMLQRFDRDMPIVQATTE